MPPSILLFLVGVSALLALPTLLVECSWKRWGLAALAVNFGVVIPLVVFFLSALLVPEWKGGCAQGWWDCFHLGKLALTPLVLWASLALYLVEVGATSAPKSPALTLALFVGMIIAAALFGYGLSAATSDSRRQFAFLLVPLYTAVWFGLRWWQAQQRQPTRWLWHFVAWLGSLPFWGAGLCWSRHIYAGLPNQVPECFVVTAASRGHRGVVGATTLVIHRGQLRHATQQLARFWTFETLWQQHAPRTHQYFRRHYNRIGPLLARHINAPLQADLVYLALKPLEWLAHISCLFAVPPPPPAKEVSPRSCRSGRERLNHLDHHAS